MVFNLIQVSNLQLLGMGSKGQVVICVEAKVTRSTSSVEAKVEEDNVARPEVDIAVHMPGTSASSVVRREALVTSTSVEGRTLREQESTGSQRPVKRELSDDTYHCLNCRILFEIFHSKDSIRRISFEGFHSSTV